MYTLVIGVKSDPVLHYFFNHARVRQDKRFLFINIDRIGDDIQITKKGWGLPCGGFLVHENVESVYNRMFVAGNVGSKSLHYLHWLLDEFYPKVVNRPKSTLTNFSKVWQLNAAKRIGFTIPKTHVYANRKVLQSDMCHIYKSISSIRSVVCFVQSNRQKVVHEPVVIQEDKGRKNIRVHQIGKCFFTQQIVSKEVDYRYDRGQLKWVDANLPQSIEQKLYDLSDEMGLTFLGADFMLQEGQYYFLEANPSPGYVYFEQKMKGSPITKALCAYLRGP